ncbi:MAG TPA: T9SS type A sorting domain-containing protein, partial [Flavobacterium sp.]|nr:T9SS type A sorting domain-containing protein [Flavobacterium sp.]
SHNYNIQIKNGNEITCTFANIGLPDSTTNEAGSHGWFSYRIKPKSGFSNGDIASSQAAIYFDFNLPIVTNEVTTQLAPLAVRNFSQDNFAVFPNPAENYFIIKSNIAESSSYEVSDANGRILKRGITESGSQVDIRDFQKGYYFVTIRSGNSKSTYKIIKQ